MSDTSAPIPEGLDRRPHLELSRFLLYFGLLGSGIAWIAQLYFKYAITSHWCFPGDVPQGPHAAHLGWLKAFQFGVDGFALAIAIAAAIVSYRDWIGISSQMQIGRRVPTYALETPSRYFALWGMVYAYCFAVAIVFDLIFVGVTYRC